MTTTTQHPRHARRLTIRERIARNYTERRNRRADIAAAVQAAIALDRHDAGDDDEADR